jgi:hypothetical protein
VRVEHPEVGAAAGEQLQHVDRRRLAVVGDVLLVGHADAQDPGAASGRPALVEQLGDPGTT